MSLALPCLETRKRNLIIRRALHNPSAVLLRQKPVRVFLRRWCPCRADLKLKGSTKRLHSLIQDSSCEQQDWTRPQQACLRAHRRTTQTETSFNRDTLGEYGVSYMVIAVSLDKTVCEITSDGTPRTNASSSSFQCTTKPQIMSRANIQEDIVRDGSLTTCLCTLTKKKLVHMSTGWGVLPEKLTLVFSWKRQNESQQKDLIKLPVGL